MSTTSTPTRSVAASGWYPDPARVADMRFWTGIHWTCWIVADGLRAWDTATTEGLLRDPETAARYEQLAAIRSYVETSAQSGRISRPAADELLMLLMRDVDDVLAPQLPSPEPVVTALPPVISPRPTMPAAPPPAPTPVRPAPRLPSPVSLMASLRGRLAVDVGVHWLAYLGVLLLFGGVVGLVAFAFSDVQRPLRPVAELAVPVATFGGAWFLGRQGSRYVARCLELAGGALLPIAVLAAFSDAASVPPDPGAGARPVTLALATMAVTVGYALVVRRRPDTPLRFLVAATTWLAAAMAALAFSHPVPAGQDIAKPTAAQTAAIAAAILGSLLLVRLRPLAYLRVPTEQAGIVGGLPVVVVLAAATAPAHGWPSWPLTATGLALAAALELLVARLGRTLVAGCQLGAFGLAVAAAPLAVSDTSRAAVLAILAIALAEWHGRRGGARFGGIVLLAGCGLALIAATVTAAPAYDQVALPTVLASVAVWAQLRRVWTAVWLPEVVVTIGATVAPPLAAYAFAAFYGRGSTLVVGATLLLVATTVVRLEHLDTDVFWAPWLTAMAGLTVLVTLTGLPSTTWSDAVAVALAALVFVGQRTLPVWRAWLAPIAAAWATGLGLTVVGWSMQATAAVVALGALLLVATSTFVKARDAGHVVLVGHVIGAAAVGAGALAGWWGTLAAAACLAGLTITAVSLDLGRSPLHSLVASHHLRAGAVTGAAWLSVVIGVPLLALQTARTAGADMRSPWMFLVATGPALVYAAIARLLPPDRTPLTTVLRHGAFWWSVAAVPIGAGSDVTACVSLAGVIAVVVALGSRAHRAMRAAARLAVAPASVTAAWSVGVSRADWGSVVLGASTAMAAAACALDLHRHGCRPPALTLRGDAVVDQFVVGAAGVVGGWLDVMLSFQRAGAGVATLLVAGVTAGIAWWLRAPVVTGATDALVLAALGLLLPTKALEHAPSLVVATAALLGVAWVWQRIDARLATPMPTWLRGDLPAFALAHVVAVLAVVAAVPDDTVLATWLPLALLSGLVGWRLDHNAWLYAGAALALGGIAAEGPPWRAAALATAAGLATTRAVRTANRERLIWQWTGVLFGCAAYVDLLGWLTAAPGTRIAISALAAGALLAAFGLASAERAVMVWGAPWAVAAAALLLASAAASPAFAGAGAWSVSAGLAGGAVGSARLADRLGREVLREACAALLLAAAGYGWYAADASPSHLAVSATLVGVVAACACTSMRYVVDAPRWRVPALVVSGGGAATSFVAAGLAGQPLRVYAFVLIGAAVDAALLGVAVRSRLLLSLTPAFAYAGWAVYLPSALGGSIQWYTVPAGLVLAVTADVARRAWPALRARATVKALDLAAVGLLMGAAIVQTVVTNILYGVVAVAIGALAGAWGIVTRVRRRVLAAGGGVALTLLCMLVVPLVGRLDAHGAGLWIAIAVGGAVAILVAAFLERAIAMGRNGLRRFREATRDWD